MSFWLVEGAYLVASALFILSLHWMNDPRTARRGVLAGVVAMALAILGTVAVAASMTNIVSGFLITDRMLKMFREKGPK